MYCYRQTVKIEKKLDSSIVQYGKKKGDNEAFPKKISLIWNPLTTEK